MDAAKTLVRQERRGPTLLLTLDNPPVNVLSAPLVDALSRALEAAEADLEARAVVIASAAEKAWGAGANIREMRELDPAAARVHGGRGQALTRRIEQLPLPVIAAVHGSCLGGGLEVAMACDFVVASDDAQFGQPEINLGVMPGWGGTRRLPRRIGVRLARRWILTGRPATAKEAEAAGLIDALVPPGELLPTALALAAELATKPPLAVAAAKYALLRAIDPEVDDGLAYELDLWSRLFGSEGQREGMAAFLEKRPRPELGRRRWKEESAGFPWAEGASPARRKGH
ncbi:MAG TPA: enoyl-CoA hydratase/isomerase family protein [Thermoplasmata archaeon]|nr:enoyl-CoA hydratase/isomerase family protein [Thermoplasmata archaeon]